MHKAKFDFLNKIVLTTLHVNTGLCANEKSFKKWFSSVGVLLGSVGVILTGNQEPCSNNNSPTVRDFNFMSYTGHLHSRGLSVCALGTNKLLE